MIGRLRIFTLAFLFISISYSCHKIGLVLLKERDVALIEIIDKTNKKGSKQTISLNINRFKIFINEINSLKHIEHETNTKANFGYFDLTIVMKNGVKYGFDVLETEYSGIVIVNRQNAERYKNDRLYTLIVDSFMIQ